MYRPTKETSAPTAVHHVERAEAGGLGEAVRAREKAVVKAEANSGVKDWEMQWVKAEAEEKKRL